MTICFDIDGCLVDRNGKEIAATIELLKVLAKKYKVFVWSGNGWKYAFDRADDLGIEEYIAGVLDKYGTFKPDVAFDDQDIELGKVNIKV